MPTAMKSPADRLARLRRLPAVPPVTGAELARLQALASSHVEPVPDADSPDVGCDAQGVAQINPSLTINAKHAAWFARHGGTRALNQALRAWIQTHQESSPRQRQHA